MAVQLAAIPKRDETVVINRDYEVPSLLHPMTGKIFVTNWVGARVMELADGTRSVERIVELILEQFEGTAPEVVRQEVLGFLEDGADKGLVAWN